MKNKFLIGLAILVVVLIVAYLGRKSEVMVSISDGVQKVIGEFNIVSTTPAESKPNNNNNSSSNSSNIGNYGNIALVNNRQNDISVTISQNGYGTMTFKVSKGRTERVEVPVGVGFRITATDIITYGFIGEAKFVNLTKAGETKTIVYI